MNEREKKAIKNIEYDMALLYGQHSIVSNEDLNILLQLLKKQSKVINEIKRVITPTKENDLSLDIQRSEIYKKLDKLLEDK